MTETREETASLRSNLAMVGAFAMGTPFSMMTATFSFFQRKNAILFFLEVNSFWKT